ncbi:NAD(P)-dependent alcohol dehydrogenase [Gordonia desulfuricans]|uniref:NAD(P)-dependent alcohol dehydrogenase n=1 Tax=Gordonia desulfuricans TaxID=89051 RepID=A0A7K3LTN2_9ACTN|nr:NAD(P)-dependent alcohol dehydrogenase [Gordonia desulfuricans]NDK91456.1 NAD(P)-dependent alcohol dehydrogenase [Gordonia desulfuricans]
MQITAAVAHGAHQDFTIEEVELAAPRNDELVVEIRGVGLCHTDIAARDGVYGLPYPVVLGHEGSGVVVAVGDDVTIVAVGDEVAVSFSSCRRCRPCTTGRPAYCTEFTAENYIGSRPDGTDTMSSDGAPVHGHFFGQSSFASHALVNERNTVKVETDLDISLVGPLGCGIQTGAGAIMNSMRCGADRSLVVLGGGPVGLAAVMGAVIQGCTPIIVVEPMASRRAVATELGATHVIDPIGTDLTAALRTIAPDGVDHIFDTTGRVDVIGAAIDAAAQNAVVGLVGVPADFSVDLPVNIVGAMQKGLTITGIVEGDSVPETFIPELLAHHAAGRFPFDTLITTYPFSKINDAIAAQERGEVTKLVLVPDA